MSRWLEKRDLPISAIGNHFEKCSTLKAFLFRDSLRLRYFRNFSQLTSCDQYVEHDRNVIPFPTNHSRANWVGRTASQNVKTLLDDLGAQE